MKSVSFISVNYKSSHLINQLEDLLSVFDVEYIVADNSGDFEPVSSRTVVVDTGGNVGFGRACNAGAQKSSSNIIIFVNPDIEINRRCVEGLIRRAGDFKPYSIWGPFIRDGKNEVPILEQPGNASLLYKRRTLSSEEMKLEKIYTSYVSGACMVVDREFFWKVQGFNKDIFLYAEDLDFCIRAKAKGAEVFLLSEFEISHSGGGSSTKMDKFFRMQRSTVGHYKFLRAHGSPAIQAGLNAIHLASGRRF
ncbi:glycosyltransferase family 2 protein [Sagittula sp. SSi028]|uniref:glycosyltransferase family 2 protein n=1 Tax=Sagittula sp. SSi028 TaxID=3400636 RepID=UPI003AF7E968